MSEYSSGARVWLLAGQELLRSGGVRSVKLRALVACTSLTTGSFYHHFESMPHFLQQLAGFYGSEQISERLSTAMADEPRQRIRRLIDVARNDRLFELDAAMRDWAGSDRSASLAVADSDARLLGFLAEAFIDLGYVEREAQLRAQLLVSIGVARVIPPWGPMAGAEAVVAVLQILAP